jgi:hypothetical protein
MQKKEKIQLIVTAVMGVILVIMVLFTIKNAKKEPVKKAAPENAVAQTGSSAGKPGALLKRLRWRKEVKEDRFFDRFAAATAVLPLERNPFEKGSSGPKDPRAGLTLEGVMWDDAKPIAIINQEFLSVGDLTGPFKVVKIFPDKVTLQDADSQFDLLLNQNK